VNGYATCRGLTQGWTDDDSAGEGENDTNDDMARAIADGGLSGEGNMGKNILQIHGITNQRIKEFNCGDEGLIRCVADRSNGYCSLMRIQEDRIVIEKMLPNWWDNLENKVRWIYRRVMP